MDNLALGRISCILITIYGDTEIFPTRMQNSESVMAGYHQI